MKIIKRVPPMALAVLLQIVPICRMACINPAVAPTGFAIVFRWFAGAAVLLGGIDAVSGASAAIAGLANLSPPGPVTTNATGTVGQPFAYRIVVTNPGSDHNKDYWNAWPLPPGLTINTNVGGNGRITGTPTVAGITYPVRLMAGNTSFPTPVYKDVMLTIQGTGSPPMITGPPTNQTVQAGANVSFTVTATGDGPLGYRWEFAGSNIGGATNATLLLNNVQVSDSGTYTVTVTNPAGSASAPATLTVDPPATLPTITTQPQNVTVTNGGNASFEVVVSGTPPFSYQWRLNGTTLPGAGGETLVITNAQPDNQGNYTVDVTNSAGSVTSSPARLTVQVPSVIQLRLANLQWIGGNLSFDITGPINTNYVLWTSPDLAGWTAVQTNATLDGNVHFVDSNAVAIKFYRATLGL